MNKRLRDKKKNDRKKERDSKVLKRQQRIREIRKVEKELEKIRYQNRERIAPIRKNNETKLDGST